MNLILLSTLALAQEPETPSEPAPEAPTEQPETEQPETEKVEPAELSPAPAAPAQGSADYASGYKAGLLDGKQVPATDFLLYGAGATFLLSGAGCCAATAAGYLVEPEKLKPRSGATIPDATAMVDIPPPPAGADPQQWAYGYAEGWTKGLQKKRAGRAFLGGTGMTVVAVGVTVVALVVVYGGLFIALNNTGFAQEPLGAGVP